MSVALVLLLPSPLLPRLVHLPFLDALGAALGSARPGGGVVDVATFPRPPRHPDAVLAAFREYVDRVRPDLVVTHSNGGRFAALAAPGVPTVHLDATLPDASGRPTPMAPPGAVEALAETADDAGLLPPWSRWWSDEELAGVLPDPVARDALHAAGHPVPLTYLRAELGAPQGWTDVPQAYVAFGAARADEVALARRQGWPVEQVAGAGHLHHLVAPAEVAAVVVELVDRL